MLEPTLLSLRGRGAWIGWTALGVLLTAQSLLTYADLPSGARTLVEVLGFFLPFILLLGWAWRHPKAPKASHSPAPSFPQGTLVLLLAVAGVLRFWKLTHLTAWPVPDEQPYGFLATQPDDLWEWKLFYFGQFPGPWIWVGRLVWKLSQDPFLSLWLPSALVSSITVLAAYWAARLWISPSYAILVGGLFAFSYWPLWLGRTDICGVLLPFWACLGLFFLAVYRDAGGKRQVPGAALCGAWSALGYLTFASFFTVSLALALGFLWQASRKGAVKRDVQWFLLTALVFSLPFAWAWGTGQVGGHILTVGFWQSDRGWVGIFSAFATYWKDLAWGEGRGGWFNPLIDTLFLLGVAMAARVGKEQFLAVGGLFFLLSLPGGLSMNVDPFRVVQLLPLVLAGAALGAWVVVTTLPRSFQLGACLLFFVLSGGMDWRQLTLPYRDIEKRPDLFRATGKSLEDFRAYRILKGLEGKPGPILADLGDSFDSSLGWAIASGSSDGPVTGASWAAAMTDLHYRPFLDRDLPGACWYPVGSDNPEARQEALVVIPVTPSNQERLKGWAAASICFRDIAQARILSTQNVPPEKTLAVMFGHFQRVTGDPFLLSCFWEKASAFFYYYLGHPYGKMLFSLQQSVKGYPAAHLYFKLGSLLLRNGQAGEARKAFEKAAKAPLNLCPTGEALRLVEDLEKKRGKAPDGSGGQGKR